MKKILSFVVFAFMFVACGSDTPDVVAKKCMNAMFEGDMKQLVKCFYFESEDKKEESVKKMIDDISYIKSMKARIKSLETSILEETKNTAEVQVTIIRNDRVDKNELQLIKIDDTWYMVLPTHTLLQFTL